MFGVVTGNSVKAEKIVYGDNTHVEYYKKSMPVRPVVYLKKTLQTNGKDSNGAWIIIDE